MRRCWWICWLWLPLLLSAEPWLGSPPMSRLPLPSDVRPENFAIAQDREGVVYVGNVDGLLIHDGERWSRLSLPNQELVRSLAVAADGRVWVGGYNSFGYLERDAGGQLAYVELADRFADRLAGREIADVWEILCTTEGVYFRALRDVFFWSASGREGDRHWQHPGRFGTLAQGPDGQVLLQFRGEGFRVRAGDHWTLLPGSTTLRNLVYLLLPLPAAQAGWLAIGVDRGWRRLGFDGEVRPFPLAESIRLTVQSENALALADGSFAFASIDGELLIVAPDGQTMRRFRLDSGFLSGIQPALGGGFLVSGEQAVHHVRWPSDWTVLGAEHGVDGSWERVVRWGDSDYLLASGGVFRMQPQTGAVPSIARLPWTENSVDDLLGLDAKRALLTSPHHLLVVSDGQSHRFSDELIYPRLFQRSTHWPGRVWVGTENGLRSLDIAHDDALRLSAVTALGVDARVNSIVERSARELWFGTERHGVWRVAIDAEGMLGPAARIEAAGGVQTGAVAEAHVLGEPDGSVLVSTRAGFFRLSPQDARFVPTSLEGLDVLRPAGQLFRVAQAPDGTRWAYGTSQLVRQDQSGAPWVSMAVESLRRGAFIDHHFDEAGRASFVQTLGLLLYHPQTAPDTLAQPQLRLRAAIRIDAGGASRRLPLTPSQPVVVEQGDFGIRFEFALPELGDRPEARYRGRLVGYEAEFSEWAAASAYTYSRLTPGDYRMEIEARDRSGRVTAIPPWPLRVEPPWHRGAWALALWTALLTLSAIAALRWLVRRRLRRLEGERRRLEALVAARTADLATANARLEQMVHLDGLTGIANRRRLDGALAQGWQQALARQHCLAALAIDVDHFKRYNDSHGHLAGDELLRRLAQTLSQVPAHAEDLLARYGGEEFMALLPGASTDRARALAEAMRVAVLRADLGVTISIGVAVHCPAQECQGDPTALLAAADAALYAAKRGGRNRVEVAEAPPGGSASPA